MSSLTLSRQPTDVVWRRGQADILLQQYPTAQLRSYVDQYGSPLLLLSLQTIKAQYQTLQRLLPRAKHHYAMKPLPHPAVIQVLKDIDGYFDLATNGEVDLVRQAGIDPARCIHTHPIKRPGDIEYALDYGVERFVFDTEYELEKLAAYKGKIQLLMRLAFPNSEAQADLSSKFGVLPQDSFALLQKAVGAGFHVAGLSFHVGSQVRTPTMHLAAIRFSRQLVDQARAAGIDTLHILDLGGGWPVTYVEPLMPISEFIDPIRAELDHLFPDFDLLSEPGRFIAGPAVTLICSVIGKAVRGGQMMYYLDDGIYNSFSGVLFDQGSYLVFSLEELENRHVPTSPVTLAGPTCDSIDVMYRDIAMPEMTPGDLLVSPVMGAYAGASHGTDFNSFMRPQIIVVD